MLVTILNLLSSFRLHVDPEIEKPVQRLPYLSLQPGLFNPLEDLNRADDSISTTVPFNKLGNLIVVKGVVDGVEGNFILDTGAPHLVLNLVIFRNYPIDVYSNEQHTSVAGGAELIHRTTVKHFKLGEMPYFQTAADLVDLGQVENSKGIKILGLIGYEMIRNCEMIIDYEAGLIHFHRIGRKEGAKYKSKQLEQEPNFTAHNIEVQNNQIMMQAEMKGKKLKFVLDSGAEYAILDSRLPENILSNVDIIGRMTVRGTGTKAVEALRGNATGLRLGNDTLADLPVLITSLEHTCFAQNMGVGGVIGLEFMQLRKIGFNFVNRKMYLWK